MSENVHEPGAGSDATSAPDAYSRIAAALALLPPSDPTKLAALAALNELLAWRTAAIASRVWEADRD